MNSIIVWSRSVVISVIITIVIEMVLPENNSKKYIKIVLGIFIVYSIISPIFEFLSGMNVDQIIDNGEAAIDASSNNVKEIPNKDGNMDDTVRNIYLNSLKQELENILEKNGYVAEQIEISIADDDSYNIDKINLSIKGKSEEKQNERQVQSIVDTVKQIVIKCSGSQNNEEEKVVNSNDIKTIKELIKNNFGVDYERINIC